MRRSAFVGLIVGAWLVVAGLPAVWAAEAAPEAASPASGVVLRFKPAVGSIVKQKITMSGRMETTGAMLPQPMRMQMKMAMSSRQKVLGQTDQGLKVQTTTSDGKMDMTMEGMGGAAGGQQSQPIPDTKMVVVMDDRGRLKQVVSSDLPGVGGGQMPLSNDALASLGSMVGFPEGAVKPDDTWSDDLKVPGGTGMPEINLSVNCRLLELLTYHGHKCAKIRTAFSGPLAMDLSQVAGAGNGAAGTMEGTLQGVFTQYYDYEDSVWAGGEGQMTMNMNLTMSAQGTEISTATKMTMNIKLSLVAP